jgi:hypothetical protein
MWEGDLPFSAWFGPIRKVRTEALLIRAAWAYWRVDASVARDIEELMAIRVLKQEAAEGRKTSCRLNKMSGAI